MACHRFLWCCHSFRFSFYRPMLIGRTSKGQIGGGGWGGGLGLETGADPQPTRSNPHPIRHPLPIHPPTHPFSSDPVRHHQTALNRRTSQFKCKFLLFSSSTPHPPPPHPSGSFHGGHRPIRFSEYAHTHTHTHGRAKLGESPYLIFIPPPLFFFFRFPFHLFYFISLFLPHLLLFWRMNRCC